MDELHDVSGNTFQQAYRQFQVTGCAVFDTSHNSVINADAAAASNALMSILGDDVDGVAAELEDGGFLA